MPLHRNNGFGGGLYAELAALPLPGAAVVIDVRQDTDTRLIRYIATEVRDLAREMRLHQVLQWRFLENCIGFLKLDIAGPEAIPSLMSSFVIHIDNDKILPLAGKNDLTRYIGQNLLNPIRNSRIKAINDSDEQTEIVSPELSTVRIFFLADLNEEESFRRAAIYADWLKEWYDDDAGPTRTGRSERVEATVICMNAAPHRHATLLTDLKTIQSLPALDTIILLQTYRDDDGYIDEEAQIYQAELLLYTLLLYWPESLDRMIDDGMVNTIIDGQKNLPRPTYIIGISAFEYSARWGMRWLDYGLAAKIVEILCDTQGVQGEDSDIHFKVESWWKDWWQRFRATVPGALIALPHMQALPQLRRVMAASRQKYPSTDTLLQGLANFRQQASSLYTGLSGATLQLALTSAPLLPAQLEHEQAQTPYYNNGNASLSQAYQALSQLQVEAQLFLLPLFSKAHGALPRASRQLIVLSEHIKDLRQTVQNPPNLNEYRKEFEKQAEEAQQRLEHLNQTQRWPLRSRKELQHEYEELHGEMCTTISRHLKSVGDVIAAHVALKLFQWADLYDPAGQTTPYQKRLDLLGQELSAAQKRALHQQEISHERLKFTLSEAQMKAVRKQNWRNLNNRKDLLQWTTVRESFLRSYHELKSNSPLMDLLAEMLLRRLGTHESPLQRTNGNGYHKSADLSQNKDAEHFQALSTALVSALLTAHIGNAELMDILPLLDQYTQMKQLYLQEPSILDSDVLDVRDVVNEAMLEQAIYGNKISPFAKKQEMPAEFVLSAWVASQHNALPALAEALDSRKMLAYMEDPRHQPSQMLADLGKQNKLVGFPDTSTGDDHFYLLLPANEASDVFLKKLNFTQMAHVQLVRFVDPEKLIYLHIHRIRQI